MVLQYITVDRRVSGSRLYGAWIIQSANGFLVNAHLSTHVPCVRVKIDSSWKRTRTVLYKYSCSRWPKTRGEPKQVGK